MSSKLQLLEYYGFMKKWEDPASRDLHRLLDPRSISGRILAPARARMDMAIWYMVHVYVVYYMYTLYSIVHRNPIDIVQLLQHSLSEMVMK